MGWGGRRADRLGGLQGSGCVWVGAKGMGSEVG